MKIATARLLIGRKIVAFDLRPFDDGRNGTAHSPIFTLDNGATITFTTEETDIGDYGVFPRYFPKAKKGNPE